MPNHSNATQNKSTSKIEKVSEIDPRIIRSPHDQKNPYVMVNKSLIHDNNLTDKCRFFLIFLLSKPEDWDFRTHSLIRECSTWLNEKKVHKHFREAIAAGYVKRVDVLEKGRRIDCIYYVAETPIYRDDSKNVARNSQKRNCENGSDILSNEKYTKKDNTEKAPEASLDPPKIETAPPSPIIFFYSFRKTGITREEYEQLSSAIGLRELETTLDAMRKWEEGLQGRSGFKRANLCKKIKKWNDDRLIKEKVTFSSRARDKELREIEQREARQKEAEKITKENLDFLNKLMQNPEIANKIELRNDFVLSLNNKSYHYLCNPGLPMWLEKVLKVKLE